MQHSVEDNYAIYRIIPNKRPGTFEIEIKKLLVFTVFFIGFSENLKLFFNSLLLEIIIEGGVY